MNGGEKTKGHRRTNKRLETKKGSQKISLSENMTKIRKGHEKEVKTNEITNRKR